MNLREKAVEEINEENQRMQLDGVKKTLLKIEDAENKIKAWKEDIEKIEGGWIPRRSEY